MLQVQRLNINEDSGLDRDKSITFLKNFCLAFSLHLLGRFSVSGFLVRIQNFLSCYIMEGGLQVPITSEGK